MAKTKKQDITAENQKEISKVANLSFDIKSFEIMPFYPKKKRNNKRTKGIVKWS